MKEVLAKAVGSLSLWYRLLGCVAGSAALPSYQLTSLTSGSLTRDDVVVDGFVDRRRQRRQLLDADATNGQCTVTDSYDLLQYRA